MNNDSSCMTKELTMGVIGTSSKENEFRIPIHPAHIPHIPQEFRRRIYFETGYSQKFGFDDEYLRTFSAGVFSKPELFEKCDIVLLPKPTEGDFPYFRDGQILWGWPHCVQGEAITQVGIDKKLTYIAFETMFLWKSEQVRDLHIFHKNNEMAGYCSTLHALQLAGITGHYGQSKKVAVISFGSTCRGAIHCLKGFGFTDITLFTKRPGYALTAPIPTLKHYQYVTEKGSGKALVKKDEEQPQVLMAQELSQYDIIINCILQNPNNPLMFIDNNEVDLLQPLSVIIDVSCDTKMGFEFARPTSFEEPTFQVGKNGQVTYYAVDHTPTYLYNAASYEISLALCPFIETVMSGKTSWEKNIIIRKSIEIEKGVIQNPDILAFQKRARKYPHEKLS